MNDFDRDRHGGELARAALWAAAMWVGAGLARAESAPVEYRLTWPGSAAGRVRVEMVVPGGARSRIFVVPRAIPMGYGEAPYDRYVSGVAATGEGGAALPVRRDAEGPRWRIEGEAPIRAVAWEVDLARMEKELAAASDASKARVGYVGILGYSVFGYLDGEEGRPAKLVVRAPEGWPVFSTLAPSAPPPVGAIESLAADFYALADSQVAMGPGLAISRLEARVPLYLAVYAETDWDGASAGRAVREAFEAIADYFGSIPFSRYTVLEELLKPFDAEHRYGFSMEHLESSTLFFSADRALRADSAQSDFERERYNLAHHIAHAWIPKRCYGEGYYPFSWEIAPVIDSIWFSEGFAQYVAIAALATGRPDGAVWRERMLERRFRSTLAEAPAFLARLTAVELSRVASTRYASDFRTGANCFSRGGLMAAEMDDEIRAKTGGRRSLRDALRFLVSWSRKERRAFRLEELPGLLTKGSGVDVRAVFEKWMRSPAVPEPRPSLP